MLTNRDIDEIIEEFKAKNKQIRVTKNNIYNVKRAYNEVKYENINKGRDYDSSKSMITAMLYDETNAKTEKDENLAYLKRDFTDLKHVYGIDNWTEKGVAKSLIKTLSDYKIPLDVLKGIKLGVPDEQSYYIQGVGKVTVIFKIDKQDDGSPTNEIIITLEDENGRERDIFRYEGLTNRQVAETPQEAYNENNDVETEDILLDDEEDYGYNLRGYVATDDGLFHEETEDEEEEPRKIIDRLGRVHYIGPDGKFVGKK